MGKRARRRRQDEGPSTGAPGREEARTTDYADEDGNVLTLRDELTPGTLRALEKLEARPAADAEDRWQRRVELLFERLAVRWEISGLPLEGQKELLGRYRLASSDERRWLRETLDAHLRAHMPELAG